MLSFLNSGFLLTEANKTFITLFPKVEAPQVALDYRPISLCNVIYKMASKVIMNRLKQVMYKLVSGFQNAFILGRLISDFLILPHELMGKIKLFKSTYSGLDALKVDFSKAYDRFSWGFPEAV